jgi:DNA polymerase
VKILTLDFETYFDADYTLKKLTTEAYIRDPRFEALGVGIREDGQLRWFTRPEEAFAGIDWSSTAVLAHHAQFDGLILSHHYGIKPALWLDTLSMARQVLGTHVSAALGSLATHYQLAAKNVPYDAFRGRRTHELDAPTRKALADGCLHDVELTWTIFQELAKPFPAEEYAVVDMTVRMFTEPTLCADIDMLGRVWAAEAARKRDLLAELGITAADLQSADRFAELLRAEGIEPPTKDGKNGPIFAFAKTDDFMKDLVEEDSTAGDLARARLGVRSTILQTRAERLGFMASRGTMPVYLRYGGAHTMRWSGGDSLNWQNFPRNSDIRRAIRAPEGYKLAVVDASQIECRLLNTIAGQEDVVQRFRDGVDPYIGIASTAYGRSVTKEDKAERGTGKQLELSCGFGCGAATIQVTAKKGTYGPPVIIDMATAERWKDIYRSSHPQVTAYWRTAGRMIARLAGGEPMEWGPFLVKDQRLYGPNGSWIDYSTLAYDEEAQEWKVKTRKGWAKLYGAKLVENAIQFAARIHMSQVMLRIRAAGYRLVNCTHDEFVALVKCDGSEYKAYEWMLAEMKRPPAWLPHVPLDAEGELAEFYAK